MSNDVGLAFLQDTVPAPADRSVQLPDPSKGGDVYQWAVDQAALIRAGRYTGIDWINVADEIESVGNSELRALTSNIEVVLLHLMKWNHQPERRSRSWVLSIREHRSRVRRDLRHSPSMAAEWDQIASEAYEAARFQAARETGLALSIFVEVCPYDRFAIMDADIRLEETGV